MSSIDMWARVTAEAETRAALAKEAATFNKAALFAALAASGVRLVTVRFDGQGDSGQIEAIDAFDAHNATIALPTAAIAHRSPAADLMGLVEEPTPVAEVIETMAYALLESTSCGWQNDDGAYGEFRFDVANGAVTLDYRERYMTEDRSQYVF